LYFFSSPNRNSKYIFRYFISSKIFKSDIPIDDLAPFYKEKIECKVSNDGLKVNDQSNYSTIYKGPGSIGDSVREISFYKYKNSFNLIIQDVGKFLIKNDSEDIEIFLLDSELKIKDNLIIESLLGPVIVFCFALEEIFCFHASAVKYKNKAILFIGKSGSGKSTLADYLDKNSGGEFERIADDIVPISTKKDKFYCLPHFPQLKLSGTQQYPLSKPSQVNIKSIYILNKDNRRTSVKIEDLEPKEKMFSLISNTVASRLFDRGLNKNHLEFCSNVASFIPVKKIDFKHDKKCLPELCKSILDDIEASKDF